MSKQKIPIKTICLIAILTLFITTGAKCGSLPAGLTLGAPKSITLTYWKVWEDKSNIDPMIQLYQKEHPHIHINYRNLAYDEFEHELLSALAVDRGPDIFSINSTWLKDYMDKIKPMPSQVTIPYMVTRGTIKQEVYTENRTKATLTYKNIKDLFPDIVAENQIVNGQVYGLPLSIDTMALFYNRDLLNNTGLINPPKTWTEFQNQVIKMTKLSTDGKILQAGAAIGTADNVSRSSDLLNLLMLQNGSQMVDANNKIYFNRIPQGLSINPAIQALEFYTSFASPAKQVYTWNNDMQDSLREFMAGKVAFFFGYAYQIPTIKAQAPGLNFGVTQMPQIQEISESTVFKPVNFANYWIETVSNKTSHPDEAWDLVIYMTSRKDVNTKYLAKARKPAALKELIPQQAEDIELAPFANQILTAQSWYKGHNVLAAEEIFKSMIRQSLNSTLPSKEIVSQAASQMNYIY
jgi:multiple sugar transport system substrate-binding protein